MTRDLPAATDAQSIKEQAAEWLARSSEGNLNGEDQSAFNAWISASLANKLAYWRLDAGWQRSERLIALRPQTKKTNALGAGLSSYLRVAGGIAAAMVLVVIGTQYALKPTEQVYSTSIGGHRILTLGDGSQVELNTDTQVRVRQDDGFRTVLLDKGEAFFQIKHDQAHPFAVIAGQDRILDLGTKFVVRRGFDRLSVSLLEGKAKLETKRGRDATFYLTPGEVAVAAPNGVTLSKRSVPALSKELAWRRGMLIFDNAPLSEVAKEFNRYNDSQLIISGAEAAHMTVGGTFKADDVAAFAEVAQSLFGLRVQTIGAKVMISRGQPRS